MFNDDDVEEFSSMASFSYDDDYNDDFVYDRIYISYCPWCGRKLGEK